MYVPSFQQLVNQASTEELVIAFGVIEKIAASYRADGQLGMADWYDGGAKMLDLAISRRQMRLEDEIALLQACNQAAESK